VICGAQAQDMRHGLLAFRARSRSVTADAVNRARAEERSLVRTWAMRNTLHLVASEDIPWLLPLFQPMLESFARRRLAQLGLDREGQDKALVQIRRALRGDGPLDRREIRARLEAKGFPMKGQVGGHVIGLAVAAGVAIEGPDGGGVVPQLVDPTEWLGSRPKHDRERALAELARRYFAAFGPATEGDFAKWSGLPLRDLRAGMSRAATRLRESSIGGTAAWSAKAAARRARPDTVRLLPAWDTYLMGYRDREFAAGQRWGRVSNGGGGIAPTIVADGRVIGTWWPAPASPAPPGPDTTPFSTLDAATRKAIDAEIADVRRFEKSAPN
jgi:hypothetical protein